MRYPAKSLPGFTLIELLIVVAIIAILAAIAVPNLLEAQVRAKVSRSKSDMRTIATGLEAYKTDNTHYPINMYSTCYYYDNPSRDQFDVWGFKPIAHERGRTVAACCWRLTTPIAYLSSISEYRSPFWKDQHYWDWVLTTEGVSVGPFDVGATYLFGATNYTTYHLPTNRMARDNPAWVSAEMLKRNHNWFIYGPGPATFSKLSGTYWIHDTDQPYDPTNGTVSIGDIARTGP
jgi:prepilin-type N-terminal cleavage/methylation domain-containing protein